MCYTNTSIFTLASQGVPCIMAAPQTFWILKGLFWFWQWGVVVKCTGFKTWGHGVVWCVMLSESPIFFCARQIGDIILQLALRIMLLRSWQRTTFTLDDSNGLLTEVWARVREQRKVGEAPRDQQDQEVTMVHKAEGQREAIVLT